jgi:TRAP-type C4-dicarboxylate transport system permease small subunit
MSTVRMVGIVVIVAGVLGLAYGGFSYTRNTHNARIGSLELSVKDTQTVNIPLWAGLGAVAVGGLLFVPWKRGRVA